ncbi:MAG: hypothetical protein ACTHM6_11715 [Tepidisphaeraceae bacterium]
MNIHVRSGFAAIFLTAALAPGEPSVGPATDYTPAPPAERQVGVAYTTWHVTPNWTNTWGKPLLGFYQSDDRKVIDQHAAWLADAGVDFIWVDWSNDIKYHRDPSKPNPTFDMIEGATGALFDEYADLRAAGKKTPNISIFAGVTGSPEAVQNGRLQRKADQIYHHYVANPRYAPLVEQYLGKPLLVVYVNTPSPFQTGVPAWKDDRFTVRWMTGYVTEQSSLRTPDLVSKFGYWSWEDRGPQTFSVYGGHTEAMVVTAATRQQGQPGGGRGYIAAASRDNGKTFLREWARARSVGPHFATVVSWNEWHRGEQPTAEISKDIEPSVEFGTKYLDLLKQQIALFKAGQ